MEHKIWDLKEVNELFDVVGVSEDEDKYYVWSFKLYGDLSGPKEVYLGIPTAEETVIEVKDQTFEMLDKNSIDNEAYIEIGDFIKSKLWEHRLALLTDYDKQISNKRTNELRAIFEEANLVVEVDRDAKLEGYEIIINEDAADNKMHMVIDPQMIFDESVKTVVGVLITGVLAPALLPVGDAVKRAVERGLNNIGNRRRNENQIENREEATKKIAKVISIEEYKRSRKNR
ncbi:hypothetical protein [Peribacillus frigoritolerans]|uniref:hypothetical protein n=1 Tax=Peribacillus frigoritolerans TaxID=450367 RepID=UPI0020BE3ECF|nr:hypothetical protein [Peribacillus frigoritolerans]